MDKEKRRLRRLEEEAANQRLPASGKRRRPSDHDEGRALDQGMEAWFVLMRNFTHNLTGCTKASEENLVEAKPACEPGRFIGRDISRGESVEAEINSFISKRHERRVKTEEERPIEDAWRASERRQEARRREENRLAWQSYFSRLAKSLRARAEEYDQRAQTLAEEQPKGDAT